MKKLILPIGLTIFLLSGCILNKQELDGIEINSNQIEEFNEVTINTSFVPTQYEMIGFRLDIPAQRDRYNNLIEDSLNTCFERGDLNGLGENACYSMTGYKGLYEISEWNLKLEENYGCELPESFVLKPERTPAFYINGDRVYSRSIDQNIEDRYNYVYTGEKLYTDFGEEYIQYGSNKGLSYEENIKHYMQYMSGFLYNLVDCKYLGESVINSNKSGNVCYQTEGKYLYFIFNENYDFHYIYSLDGAGAPCISGVFSKVEFFSN